MPTPRPFRPLFAAAFLLTLLCAQAPAQAPRQATPPAPAVPQAAPDQQPNTEGPITTLKAQALEVNLIFTVTDKHGHFVTGLQQQNFGLLDDHKRPEAVIRFTQQTNLPLRVGIMLDTSSSIRQRFEFEQQAAKEFFSEVLHQNDRAFVEGFDVQLDVAQPFTNNVALLDNGIDKLRPGGGTSLYDSLYQTCRDQMLTLREQDSVRKAIILVSDGDDNYSRALQSDAIKMCQRAETIVYAISTNVSLNKGKGDDVLTAITQATGGSAFFPNRIEDVATGFHNIEEELRSQYSLEYKPADFKADGSFRTIYLQALDRQHYVVRARTGYFAPRASE
jgi:VWFA-related protein